MRDVWLRRLAERHGGGAGGSTYPLVDDRWPGHRRQRARPVHAASPGCSTGVCWGWPKTAPYWSPSYSPVALRRRTGRSSTSLGGRSPSLRPVTRPWPIRTAAGTALRSSAARRASRADGHSPRAGTPISAASAGRLYTRDQVLTRPCPVPVEPGVYAWYFDRPPGGTPLENVHSVNGWSLLYVGISPRAPRPDGTSASRQSLRSRLRYHYRGNAYGSTLRLTLGSLLAEELGIGLRRVGSGTRLTLVRESSRCRSGWAPMHASAGCSPDNHGRSKANSSGSLCFR